MTRALPLALLLGACAASLQAATPIEDELPIELARYFAPGTWYADLPPDWPSLPLPSGLSVVGSHATGEGRQVVYRTETAAAAAIETFARELATNPDWIRFEHALLPDRNGFVARNATAAAARVSFCHASLGTLGASVVDVDLIRVDLAPLPRASDCLRQQQMRQVRAARDEAFIALPRLEIDLSDQGLPVVPQQVSSGGGDVSASAELALPGRSLRNLANDFARQMRRQGWRRESAWRGEVTAGSTWTHATANGGTRLAAIDIVRLGEGDFYSLELRMGERPRGE